MNSSLTLTQAQHALLHDHLFPGDGLEAAALLICSRTPGPRLRLLVQDIRLVPHEACVREPDWLTWPGSEIEAAIDAAEAGNRSVVLMHSHPGDLFAFSLQDDCSDQITLPGLYAAIETLHGSAIMTSNGAMLARVYEEGRVPRTLNSVGVVGNDLRWWWADQAFGTLPMAFSSDGTRLFGRLCACVIGASGTGSIVTEQLARLGFGRVQIIDFDRVEPKNLNRILNSSAEDAQVERPKVEVLARAIDSYRAAGVAVPLDSTIFARDAVVLASQADVLFCCVDSLEGRHIADLMGAAFLQPLLDVGVVIPTRDDGGNRAIADVYGRVDYVRPDGASLGARGVYSAATLRAEYLRHVDSAGHAAEVEEGYIRGLPEEAPSVISLNMRAAAACVLELIARILPFRHDSNAGYARTLFSVAGGEEDRFDESEWRSPPGERPLARGDREPLLAMPALAAPRLRG